MNLSSCFLTTVALTIAVSMLVHSNSNSTAGNSTTALALVSREWTNPINASDRLTKVSFEHNQTRQMASGIKSRMLIRQRDYDDTSRSAEWNKDSRPLSSEETKGIRELDPNDKEEAKTDWVATQKKADRFVAVFQAVPDALEKPDARNLILLAETITNLVAAFFPQVGPFSSIIFGVLKMFFPQVTLSSAFKRPLRRKRSFRYMRRSSYADMCVLFDIIFASFYGTKLWLPSLGLQKSIQVQPC